MDSDTTNLYQEELERASLFGGETFTIRPMRPDDKILLRQFLATVSPQDLRLRFFATIKEFSDQIIAKLTELDYSRAIAYVAIEKISGDFLGVVRLHIDSSAESGEYAILVRSDLKGHGLGWRLMELITEYARLRGLKRMEGEVLAENTTMLQMCQEMGFQIKTELEEPTVCRVKLNLNFKSEEKCRPRV